MNTRIHRKGGNCISKALSVSKGIPLNISHTHPQTHINMQSGIFQTRKKWTNTNTRTYTHRHTYTKAHIYREGSEGLQSADDSS